MIRSVLVHCIAYCCMTTMLSAGPIAYNKTLQRKYLEKFNHLGAYNPDPLMASLRVSNPDEEFRMAVKSFQRFAGLAMTGNVDPKTAEMMEADRCGVADLQNNMGSVTRRRRKRYTVQGQKWTQEDMTYRILNHMQGRTMTPEQVKQVIQQAFDTWSQHIPLTFRENTDSKYVEKSADIEISFGRLNHGDNSPFDGPGQTLAHAYFPGLGIGGDMHFDDDETFTANTLQGTNLLQVAIHELGHSLGLGHSENQEAIMAPFYKTGIPENTLKLHMDDINGIKYLYPGSKKTVTTPAVRPVATPEQVGSVIDFCSKASLDAIDTINGITHLFYGDKYVQLEDDGNVRPGFPKLISGRFPGVPSNLDAVLSLEHLGGAVYFFKGASYWLYNKTRPNSIRQYLITQTFGPNLDRVDAAFVWGGSGAAYFIKGSQYFRYSLYRGLIYPSRPLSEWKKLPSTIDDAFQHPTTLKTYFFSGTKYYVVHDMSFSVQQDGDIYDWVHCCSIRLQAYMAKNPGGISSSSNRPSNHSFTTFFIGLFVALSLF